MTPLTDERLDEIEKAAESFMAVVKARFRPDLNYDDLPRRESSAAFVCSQVGQLIAQARRNRRVEEAAKKMVDALEQYARFDYYHFLLDRIGQQTDPTKKAKEALTEYLAALKETTDAN